MTSDATGPGPLRGPSSPDWWTPGRFALLLFLLILAAFPDVLSGRRTFFYRDYAALAYPAACYSHASFWRGELPLWNPLNHCGVPFLAQWGTLALYPLSLVFLLLPLPWSLGLFSLGHFHLGGLGAYFLARRWTGNGFAASAAGVAYVFNGINLSSLMWPNHQVALGWLPWVVLSAEAAWRRGGPAVAVASGIGALQLLSGVPETILLTWLFVLGLWLSEWKSPPAPRGRMALRLGTVVVLAAGLTAAQLLPFGDLLAHSQRDRGYGDNEYAMAAWGWANFLVPLFHCYRVTQGLYFQTGQEFYSSCYPGAAVVVLALSNLGRRRDRRVWVLLTAVLLALLLAPGSDSFVFAGLKKAVPLIGVARYPVKFLVWTALALPFLAAFALRDLTPGTADGGRGSAPLRRVAGWGLVALGLMGALVWWAHGSTLPPRVQEQLPALRWNTLVRAAFLAAAAAAIGLWWRSRSRRDPVPWPLIFLLVLWLDVLTHVPSQNPTIESIALEPGLVRLDPRPEHGRSRVMLSPWAEVHLLYSRIPDFRDDLIGKRMALWLNLNLIEGIPRIGGAFTLQVREEEEIERLLYRNIQTDLPRLADFLSVSHSTKPGEIVEWSSRDSYLPMVTAGAEPVFADPPGTLGGLAAPDFDGRRMVYLPAPLRDTVPASRPVAAKVSEAQFAAQRVSFRVDAPAPALAVLSQTWYGSWKARVDGRAAPVLRANHAFQAVVVPAGQHAVVLTYEDAAFQCGLVISVLTLAGVLCYTVSSHARPREFSRRADRR